MPTQGPNSPGTLANQVLTGYAWSNPSNAGSSDNSYASVVGVPNNTSTDRLNAESYGFSIPTEATILGIVVSWEGYTSGSNGYCGVRVRRGGTEVGSFKGDYFPTSEGTTSVGGSSDLWGTTWTPAQINGSDFGAQLSPYNDGSGADRDFYVDHIPIMVYYALPGNPNSRQAQLQPILAQ